VLTVYKVLEDYLLLPKIIGRAVPVPEVVIVVAVLLGGTLAGRRRGTGVDSHGRRRLAHHEGRCELAKLSWVMAVTVAPTLHSEGRSCHHQPPRGKRRAARLSFR
jgi:hypothetical protein